MKIDFSSLSAGGLTRTFYRQSLVYLGGGFASRIAGLILLPVYLVFLSPRDFGLIVIAEAFASVMMIFFGLGVSESITRFYAEWEKRGDTREALGSLWWTRVIASFLLVLLLDRIFARTSLWFFEQLPFHSLGRMALWNGFFSSFVNEALKLFRASHRSKWFVALSNGTYLLSLTMSIIFVAGRKMGAEGVLMAQMLSNGLAGLVCAGAIANVAAFRFTGPLVREGFRFALPLVPAGMLATLIDVADRFFLDRFAPLPVVGLYAVAQKIGSIVQMLLSGVAQSWAPFFMQVAIDRPDAPRVLKRFGTLFAVFIGAAGVVTAVFAPDVLRYFAAEKFAGAVPYLPWILLYVCVAVGWARVFHAGLLIGKRTRTLFTATVIQAAALFAGYLIFVPSHGVAGLLAVKISVAILHGLALAYLSARAYPISFEFSKLIALLAVGVAVAAVALTAIPPLTWSGGVLKIAGLVVFGVSGYFLAYRGTAYER